MELNAMRKEKDNIVYNELFYEEWKLNKKY